MPEQPAVRGVEDLWPLRCTAAIFDFDGTVADSLGVWRRVDDLFFERRGLTYAPDYAERLSMLGFEEGARYTIDAYDLDCSVQEVCDEWNALGRELYRTSVNLRPGAAAYIKALHAAGVPVGLATTNAPAVIDAMETRVPLHELFPVRVHGCEVPHPTKDHPDIYLECARRLGVEPAGCVVFEDLLAGVLTAKRAGMAAVGVLTGAPSQNVGLLRKAADVTIADWSQLAAAVRR